MNDLTLNRTTDPQVILKLLPLEFLENSLKNESAIRHLRFTKNSPENFFTFSEEAFCRLPVDNCFRSVFKTLVNIYDWDFRKNN